MNKIRTLSGRWKWRLLVLLALTLTWGRNGAQQLEADVTTPDFSIEVKAAGCDTKGVSPTTCEVPVGSVFTVSVHLNDIDGLVDKDADTKAGYIAVQARLNYSAGLTLKNRPGVTELEGVWPDCFFPAENKGVGTYLAACAIDVETDESIYIGRVMEVDYNCTPTPSTGNTVSLVHGPLRDTFVGDETPIAVAEQPGLTETLTISCAPAIGSVGGIAELPEVAGTSLEAPDSSGTNTGLLAGSVAAVAAGAIALGGAAWYGRRRS